MKRERERREREAAVGEAMGRNSVKALVVITVAVALFTHGNVKDDDRIYLGLVGWSAISLCGQSLRGNATSVNGGAKKSSGAGTELFGRTYNYSFAPSKECQVFFTKKKDMQLFCDKEPMQNNTCYGEKYHHGTCVLHTEGQFRYKQGDQPAHPPQSSKLCADLPSAIAASKLRLDGSFYDIPSCEMVDSLDPVSLLQLSRNQRGKRVFFIGASHLRNMFHGLIGSTRLQRLIIERHSDSETKSDGVVLKYEVFEDRDHYEVLRGHSHILDALHGDEKKKNPPVITFIYVWANQFRNQRIAFKELLPLIKPHLIVNSVVGGHESRIDVDPEWEKDLKAYMLKHKPAYIWYQWERRGVDVDRGKKMLNLTNDFRSHGIKSSYIPYKLIEDKVVKIKGAQGSVQQAAQTWHYACQITPNYSPKTPDGTTLVAKAKDSCFDPYDRAFARLTVTQLYSE